MEKLAGALRQLFGGDDTGGRCGGELSACACSRAALRPSCCEVVWRLHGRGHKLSGLPAPRVQRLMENLEAADNATDNGTEAFHCLLLFSELLNTGRLAGEWQRHRGHPTEPKLHGSNVDKAHVQGDSSTNASNGSNRTEIPEAQAVRGLREDAYASMTLRQTVKIEASPIFARVLGSRCFETA